MVSTVDDVARFYRDLLGGQLLPAPQLAQIQLPTMVFGDPNGVVGPPSAGPGTGGGIGTGRGTGVPTLHVAARGATALVRSLSESEP